MRQVEILLNPAVSSTASDWIDEVILTDQESLLMPTTRSCHKGCRRRGRQKRTSLRVTISQKRKLELKKQQRQKLVWIQNTADRRGGGELVLFHVIKPDRRERNCRGRRWCLSSPCRDLNTSFCEGDGGPCGPCVIVNGTAAELEY